MASNALGNLAALFLVGGGGLVAFELAKNGDFGPRGTQIAGQIAAMFGGTATAGGGGGAPGTYNTVNGVKTVAQMLSELDAQNGGPGTWKGDRSNTGVAAAYAAITKGPVTAN
jgi:hypothetical protein